MRIETQARELALKALYQYDLLDTRTQEELRSFCAELADAEVTALAVELVQGCIQHQQALDETISQAAENWELERMAASDRNILRLGVYELLFREETPPKVAINEAIELAKKYSTEKSPTFVNGVLDRIYNTQVAGRSSQQQGGPAATDGPLVLLGRPATEGGQGRVDLHVHSTASDGSYPPEDLPALAAKAGLGAFALTDHDSVEGTAAASEAASALGIELVTGVELTGYQPSVTGENDIEVHIAGLFVDPCSPALLDRLRELRTARVGRIEVMTRKLHELGAEIESDRVIRRAHGGSVGRVHVAQELVEQGLCKDLSEVFDRYLGIGGPAYVPKDKMTPAEAIQLIKAAGGCAVLCHPGLTAEVKGHIEQVAEAGLDALEVHYPMHTAHDQKRLLELAQRLGLAVAGGSDFHGAAKPSIHIGQETVSLVELEELRRRAEARA